MTGYAEPDLLISVQMMHVNDIGLCTAARQLAASAGQPETGQPGGDLSVG